MAKEPDKQLILDDRFFLPPGVIDVRSAGEENGVGFYDPEDVAVDGPTLLTAESTIPIAPTSFQVVDQHVRIGSDGRAVVDVTLEFPDLPGVYSIEVGLSKA